LKKTTIGIIGTGRIGRLHAENLIRFPEVTIKAVSDLFIEHAKEWTEGLGIPVTSKDYNVILNDPEIEAVFICSSTDTHAQFIIEAARKGKHIFCEKPVSLDFQNTKEALDVVKEMGVKLQVGFNRRFDHNFKRAQELVASGRVGNPHIIKITSRDPNPPSKEYIQVSGGMFLDMTIHDFDIARFLCGSDVEEIFVQGAVLVDPVFGEYGDVDTAITTLTFKNGAIGVIDNSRKAVYGYDQRVEVFGSKGCVTISNDYPSTVVLSTGEAVVQDKPKYFFLERYQQAYIDETKAFIACIQNDEQPSVGGNDSFQAELLGHAAKKSWEEKRPVKILELLEEMKVKP
jgi:myo-inositol 2-dehydrogenase/D-chiro-inositol 1-dehydrogenase